MDRLAVQSVQCKTILCLLEPICTVAGWWHIVYLVAFCVLLGEEESTKWGGWRIWQWPCVCGTAFQDGSGQFGAHDVVVGESSEKNVPLSVSW